MINRITLDNFKAFKHAEIEIKPITILVGPNNGGKTSILQAIGLIKQTLRFGDKEVLKFKEKTFLNLGDYDTLIHQDYKNREIRLRFDFENNKYFDINVLKNQDNTVYIKDFSCNNGQFEYIIKDIEPKKTTNKEESEYYTAKTFEFELKKTEKEYEKYKNFYKNLYPTFYRSNFFFIIAFYEEKKDKKVWISDFYNSIKVDKERFGEKFLEILRFYLNLQKISTDFYQNVKQDFQNITYIGPLRANAIRSYEKGDFDDVGLMGEHAPQILASDSAIRKKVENYLKDFEVANSLYVSEIEENSKIFELKLKTKITDKEVNYADTGCGTAQIIPLIAQSLMKQKEALILIEQPEIHLHPKVQADLANFFVNFASNEKKFLLETHSDYFIERIRYCIMNGDISSDDVAIYYIEQDEDKKCSTLTEIKINSKGQYSTLNLPNGNLPDNYVTNFSICSIVGGF